jgi:hypothetical protein
MLYLHLRRCGIVALVPAPHARTADISPLASRRLLWLRGRYEPRKLQCRKAERQNQQRDDNFESGHGSFLRFKDLK